MQPVIVCAVFAFIAIAFPANAQHASVRSRALSMAAECGRQAGNDRNMRVCHDVCSRIPQFTRDLTGEQAEQMLIMCTTAYNKAVGLPDPVRGNSQGRALRSQATPKPASAPAAPPPEETGPLAHIHAQQASVKLMPSTPCPVVMP